jgi:CRISPR type III-A-associated protein Csm2
MTYDKHRDRRDSPSGFDQKIKDGIAKQFYDGEYMEKDHIRELACEIAEKLVDAGVTTTQLRKFYHEARSIWDYVDIGGDVDKENRFKKKEVQLVILIARAKYSTGRASSKLSPLMSEYLETYINKIQEYKHLKAFILTFEAMVGYFYSLNPKK